MYLQSKARIECSDIGTHWIALYPLKNNVTYFDGFDVEHIPKEIKIFIDKSIVVANIFRIQANDSVMCKYFALDLLTLYFTLILNLVHP